MDIKYISLSSGIEPLTYRLTAWRYYQLSYESLLNKYKSLNQENSGRGFWRKGGVSL